jgi:hypothetical protein
VWPPWDSSYIYHDEPNLAVGSSDITKNITLDVGLKVSGYVSARTGGVVHGAVVVFGGYYLSGWGSNASGYYFASLPSGTYDIWAHPLFGATSATQFIDYRESNVAVYSSMVKNITVDLTTPPPQNSSSVQVQLVTTLNGQASFTNEKTHTSSQSVKLELPADAQAGASATALYPYNGTLSSLNSFSIYTSYTNATPRFVIYLDTNNDGQTDKVLLSDYQFQSSGQWSLTTGGLRWGWTEANTALTIYGQNNNWKILDDWKIQYGTAKVLYVGITLEYWGVMSNSGLGQPLYADELMLNGVLTGPTYTIMPR